MSPRPKRSSGQSEVRTASISASTSAWCQARAVLTSAKSRTTSQLSKLGSSTKTGVCPGPGAGRHLRGSQSRRPISVAGQFGFVDADREFAQLQLVDRGRGAGQQVEARGGLREGDHVADRLGAGEALDDAVDAVGDAAVRRRPVLQRLEQEAEDRLLRLRVVDTNRAAAQLLAVPDDVVGLGAGGARVLGVELTRRRGE